MGSKKLDGKPPRQIEWWNERKSKTSKQNQDIQVLTVDPHWWLKTTAQSIAQNNTTDESFST